MRSVEIDWPSKLAVLLKGPDWRLLFAAILAAPLSAIARVSTNLERAPKSGRPSSRQAL
jgi:hypothetical protein